MPTSLEELARWMAAPREGEHLEFKEAKNQYDLEKLYRYCVALANEGGGKLILGVTNSLPRRVVGTHAFPAPGDTASKILAKLKFRVDPEEITHPDGRVLVFHIPSRPKGTAYTFEGASRIIRETLDAEQIKLDDPSNVSKRYVKYVPFWA